MLLAHGHAYKRSIVISALLCSAAFVIPSLFFWTIYCYLTPLFYLVIRNTPLKWGDGFLWGIIFFGIHLIGIGVLLAVHVGSIVIAALGYGLLVLYYSLLSGFWFIGVQQIAALYHSIIARLFIWTFVTTLFNIFITDYSSFVFGVVEGYPFSCLLIPLAEYPQLLWLLPHTGLPIFIFLLIASQACIVYGIEKRSAAVGGLAVVWLTMIISGVLFRSSDQPPTLIHSLGYTPAPVSAHCPRQAAQEIVHNITALCDKHPEISIILMPESTCKFPLNEHPYVMHTVLAHMPKHMHLFFGGHRSERERLYNCLYHATKRLIMPAYDKQHLAVFGETLPIHLAFLKKYSASIYKNFCCGKKEDNNSIFRINDECVFNGAICSEIYFQNKKPDNNYPILLLANDSWVTYTPYYEHLLFLTVCYKAILWQQPIIYVAHSGAWWVGGVEKTLL